MELKPNLFMVLDVESIGLHGEGFAVGYVVVNRAGETLEEDTLACDPGHASGTPGNRRWVLENVPAMEYDYFTPDAVRNAFWVRWQAWKERGAVMVADCCWPVEARFLAACVDDAGGGREWDGPYPLHDLASVLLALGRDPLATNERLPNELPAHHPLNDARQSARLLAAALSAAPAQEPADEHPAEEALRSIACWLGVGGYNAPTVDAKLYEHVTVYSQLHGFAARDLAETVLHMDLITPKGIRARELARQVLGIVPPFASPLPQEPQEGKALTDERINELAAEYGDELDQAFIFNRLGRFSAVAFARAIERELRGAQEGKAGEWLPIESAPKDGAFLVANAKGNVCACQSRDGQRIVHNMPVYADWMWGDDATHWQPLPPPPSATLASREGEQR